LVLVACQTSPIPGHVFQNTWGVAPSAVVSHVLAFVSMIVSMSVVPSVQFLELSPIEWMNLCILFKRHFPERDLSATQHESNRTKCWRSNEYQRWITNQHEEFDAMSSNGRRKMFNIKEFASNE
jgi:hypothetical protein